MHDVCEYRLRPIYQNGIHLYSHHRIISQKVMHGILVNFTHHKFQNKLPVVARNVVGEIKVGVTLLFSCLFTTIDRCFLDLHKQVSNFKSMDGLVRCNLLCSFEAGAQSRFAKCNLIPILLKCHSIVK